jgi:sirohydrochlorin ferrochelatase
MAGPSELKVENLAVVLVAHGSRNAEANADAFHFAERLRVELAIADVEAAFLELAEPDIPTAVGRALQFKPGVVVLLPYFLSAGVHVRQDLADLCKRFEKDYAPVRFVLAEPLGRHQLLTSVLADRLGESITNSQRRI